MTTHVRRGVRRATSPPLLLGLLALVFAFSVPPLAHAQDDDTLDLLDLSLEDLVNMEVTTVSKRKQRLIDSASAVHVLTADDIRRSGMTSLPELLRLVPGLNVARFSTSSWGVSSRGANSIFTNDLLVMIDGRSVYTPLFAGTYWDVQSVTLEDIERIEVVRGPGGAVWGANAVNGVINIIRKSAKDAQQDFVSAAVGNEDRVLTNMRLTQKLGDTSLRMSGNWASRDDSHSPLRGDGNDDWRQGTLGFAMDWDATDRDLVTFQGDWYSGTPDVRVRVDTATSVFTNVGQSIFNHSPSIRGGNVLGRWTRTISETNQTQLQLYWDRRLRDGAKLFEDRQTYDMDFQHSFNLGDRHALTWGTGARLMLDDLKTSFNAQFVPDHNEEVVYNGFFQDEISLIPETLALTLGAKTEWNTYTGWEIAPSARMLWGFADKQQIWTAVSRSFRTPSRAARELSLLVVGVRPNPAGPPFFVPVTASGNRDQESEYTVSYELGYRIQPMPSLSFDVATFYDVLENGNAYATPTANPAALFFENRSEAHYYGAELSSQWQAAAWARLKGSYSFFRTGRQNFTDTAPTHKFQVQSYLDLPGDFELDTWLSFYGRTDSPTTDDIDVRSNWRLDMRLGWEPRPGFTLSLVGQNLIHDEVEELTSFTDTQATGPLEVERAFYVKATWEF